MIDVSKTATPWHLWVMGVLALLWNGFAGYDFIMTLTQGEAYMRSMKMSEEMIAFYATVPAWTYVPWAVGGWGGVIGALLLLVRSRWAFHAFALSVFGVLGSIIYAYGLSEGGALSGTSGAVLWGVIAVVAVFLAWYAGMMTKRGVLR
jgi:hypothetical protein